MSTTTDVLDEPFVDLPNCLTQEQRAELSAALVKVAAWVEYTDAPIHRYMGQLDLTFYASWLEEQEQAVLNDNVDLLVKAIGGMVRKQPSGEYMHLRRDFGAGLVVQYSLGRAAVCEARVVGKEEHWGGEYTDKERAVELQAELDKIKKKEQVDVLEYDCAPILGRDAA